MSSRIDINDAHIYLLTDLFLICERVGQEELHQAKPGATMWLLFPPLAGKHLRVRPVEHDPEAFEVVIMKRETLVIRCQNQSTRDTWLSAFDDCIRFGAARAYFLLLV